MSKSWADISLKLDPNMKQEDYDNLRLRYFHSVVAPKVRPGYSVESTYKDFLSKTERPKTMGPSERLLVGAGLFATAATKAMVPGVDVNDQEKLLHTIADREGISKGLPEGAGQFLGAGIALGPIFNITGPVSRGLAMTFLKSGKALDVAAKVARGGMAFAAYDTLEAKDGDRTAAGLRGAMWGALTEAGLGAIFGFSDRAVPELVKKSMNNEPIRDPRRLFQPTSPGTEGAGFTHRPSAETGFTHKPSPKQLPVEGEPIDVEFTEHKDTPQLSGSGQPQKQIAETSDRGARQLGNVRGSGGKIRRQFEAPGATPPLGMGYSAAMRMGIGVEAQKAVAEGTQATVVEARLKGYLTGPMVETPSIKGLRVILKDKEGMPTLLNVPRGTESEVVGQIKEALDNGGSIDGIHFHPASRARASELMRGFAVEAEATDRSVRMMTPKGKAGDVARSLNKMGLQGTVANDSTVLVGPEAPWVKAQKAKAIQKAADEFISKGGKPPQTSDAIAKNLFRQGEIRTMMHQGPQPRAIHQELHHLQGELGQRTGILNRADLGQLGLRYFERTVSGETIDAEKMIAAYKGERGPVGERPPVGNKEPSGVLKGYRKATGSPAEGQEWSAEDEEIAGMAGKVRVRPTGTTKILEQKSGELGFEGAQISTPEGPMRVLSADISRGAAYHEAIHEGLSHAGLDEEIPSLIGDHKVTAVQIGQGLLKEYEGYDGAPFHQMVNEAFTHAAEAVRMNDEATLAQLGKWDTSVDHVKSFVNQTSRNALEASMKGDSAPIRAFQRRMTDLVRRTDPMRTAALQRAAVSGYTTWYSPEIAQWVMRDGEGREYLKPSITDVWDHLEQADASSHFPDIAHKAYFKGLRGPMVPIGTEPIDGPATLETDEVPLGWQAIRGITQPTLDWAASVQSKLKKFGKDIDFYGSVKAIDDSARKAHPEMDRLDSSFRTIVKDVPKARRVDYGEVLSHDESQWASMAKGLDLGPEDLANVREIKEWDRAQTAAGGVSLVDTLKTMRKVREAGGDVARALSGNKSPAADAIRNGSLGYNDLHVGQVKQWVLRKSIDQRFMDEPLKAFEKIMATKGSSGKPLLEPIAWQGRNYVNYMRGIPDQSQKILNDWIQGMTTFATDRAKQLNRYLPKGLQLPEQLGTPKELLSKYQLLLYTAGLGARPAVYIRDTFQGVYSMAVMGPTSFAEGLAKALTSAGRDEARAAGATLHGRNVGEFFGDISGDLPTSGRVSDYAVKAADALLSPSRMGHNIPRMIAYLGEKARAMREIEKFRSGVITDPNELATRTSVWFQDAAPKARLLAMAANPNIPTSEVAHQFALALNDGTQFALRSGTQGAILRTGMGRIFGQYGTWPMNYIEFTRKLVSRAADTPKQGVPALATWMAMNYGAFKAANEMGIDASKWLFFSPAGYAGSPNLELLQNIMAAPEESQAGLDARRKLHQTPMEFVPTGVELTSIYNAIESGEVSIPKLLGFRPSSTKEDQDLQDWLYTETGFTKPRP